MSDRKWIGIEALLRWAFRDELPKAQAVLGLHVGPAQFGQAWGGVARYGDLLTVIDGATNPWGLAPDLTATREPHPDAVSVGLAVEALDGLELDLPEGWDPLDDMAAALATVDEAGPLLAETVRAASERAVVADLSGNLPLPKVPGTLVRRHAIAGTAPDWRGDVPDVTIESAYGKPRWFVRELRHGLDGPYEIEADGFDRKLRIPKPGAYQRHFLDPDPLPVALERAEWEVWRAALDVLHEDLSPVLTAWKVSPCDRPLRPWVDGGERRVLEDLTRPVAPPMLLRRGQVFPLDPKESSRTRLTTDRNLT